MAELIQFPQARRRREPQRRDWLTLWPELPVLPTPEQEEFVWRIANHIARTADSLGLKPEPSFHEFMVETGKLLARNQAGQKLELAWPPRSHAEWETLSIGLLKLSQALGEETAGQAKPSAPPALTVHTRRPHDALWAAIWPELRVLPTPRQERLISALVAEISGLMEAAGGEPLREPVRWLTAMLKKISTEAWPPREKAFWGKACKALKARQQQLVRQVRRRNQRSPEQNRMLWALVRERLGGDRTVVDELLKSWFPDAVRKDPAGKLLPSTSALTKSEAHELIEMLRNPAYTPRRRRKVVHE
ncbi:MAG: hypothetical protein V1797_17185 [Pseudomonadota bacterium]